MAQLIFHPKNHPNFKKSYMLKAKKQKYHLGGVYMILLLSLALNVFFLFHK